MCFLNSCASVHTETPRCHSRKLASELSCAKIISEANPNATKSMSSILLRFELDPSFSLQENLQTFRLTESAKNSLAFILQFKKTLLDFTVRSSSEFKTALSTILDNRDLLEQLSGPPNSVFLDALSIATENNKLSDFLQELVSKSFGAVKSELNRSDFEGLKKLNESDRAEIAKILLDLREHTERNFRFSAIEIQSPEIQDALTKFQAIMKMRLDRFSIERLVSYSGNEISAWIDWDQPLVGIKKQFLLTLVNHPDFNRKIIGVREFFLKNFKHIPTEEHGLIEFLTTSTIKTGKQD